MTEPQIQTMRVAAFSPYPGGRRRPGVHSGEEFRDEILLPALRQHDLVCIDFRDAKTVIPSFVDEVLGPVIKMLGLKEFKRRITWQVEEDSDVGDFIAETLRQRS